MAKMTRRGLLLAAFLTVPFAACGCGRNANTGPSPPGPPVGLSVVGSGGPGAPADFGGSSQPGQILPPSLQERLKLSAEQRKQVEELQKEADGELDKILTGEQKKQLKEMQEGPGRPEPRPVGPPGL
jgi:hypothetical protein